MALYIRDDNPHYGAYTVLEAQVEALREKQRKRMVKYVERQALRLGYNISSTQMGADLSDWSRGEEYPEEVEYFIDFVNHISDDFGIEMCFEVKDGVFTWY